jgi:xanthine/CO dehydrogenase XdhC/CoxF family maturation factor
VVYAVDAFNLIFQVFHALPEMTSPSGQPVAAVHGFIRDIVDLIEKKRPDYLFCAFDPPGPTFRKERYPQYKANREEMPQDLRAQIPEIQRMLDALAVPVLQYPGYEADDVLAVPEFRDCLSRLTVDENSYIVIVTRGHMHDQNVLAQAIKTPAAYIGMIGSRRKNRLVYDALIREGIAREEDFERVHAPIGLPIGGDTPEEIALYIVA